MNGSRREKRNRSSEKCAIELRGMMHGCRLENVSSSGVLVNCTGFLQETWPGDDCVLHLSDQGAVRCRVTHIAASKIGLKLSG